MNTIFVSGAIANKPFNGGAAWTRLNYVLGLRKLGFDVQFVENIHPAACIGDDGNPCAIETSANIAYFRRVSEELELTNRMTLVSPDRGTVEGIPFAELLDIAESAVLLVNISGNMDLEPLTSRIRRRVFIDLDPGFTQFWHADGSGAARLAGHHHYFTVGENIGAADCLIPVNGIGWKRTRQPIVLDYWPVSREGDEKRFTTISTWRGPFGPVSHGGRTFGSKVHEFRKYVGIPGQTDATFELASTVHPGDRKDRDLLVRNSWRLVDPRQVAHDPFSFRRYIQTSGAEFSVAQQMYVDTRSGWFSDRTVRYLASGKPALVQETGFTRYISAGEGLVAFSSPHEAVAGVRSITERYSEHAAAARCIAEEYFDSNRVLSELLTQVL